LAFLFFVIALVAPRSWLSWSQVATRKMSRSSSQEDLPFTRKGFPNMANASEAGGGRTSERTNDINQQMRNIARAMTPQEIDEAAAYYASQPPEIVKATN
jgi:hypothetical protein